MDASTMKHLSENLLNAYLDELLEESDRQQADAHLAECKQCHTRLQELQLVFSSLAALPEVSLARDLTPSILSRLPIRPSLFARPRTIALQWGFVLGVAIWSAMQIVSFIELPTAENLLRFAMIELPVFSLSAIQIPSLSLPQLEFASFNLPVIGLHFTAGQISLVAVSALLLWLVGNFTLLRRNPQGSHKG